MVSRPIDPTTSAAISSDRRQRVDLVAAMSTAAASSSTSVGYLPASLAALLNMPLDLTVRPPRPIGTLPVGLQFSSRPAITAASASDGLAPSAPAPVASLLAASGPASESPVGASSTSPDPLGRLAAAYAQVPPGQVPAAYADAYGASSTYGAMTLYGAPSPYGAHPPLPYGTSAMMYGAPATHYGAPPVPSASPLVVPAAPPSGSYAPPPATNLEHAATVLGGGPQPFYFAHLIPVKLTPDNYLAWRAQVLPLLRSRYFEGYVDGTLPCPPRHHPAYHACMGGSGPGHPLCYTVLTHGRCGVACPLRRHVSGCLRCSSHQLRVSVAVARPCYSHAAW